METKFLEHGAATMPFMCSSVRLAQLQAKRIFQKALGALAHAEWVLLAQILAK